MQFTIHFRAWTGKPPLTVEIGAEFEARPPSVQLGAAVKVALSSGADLRDAADLSRAVLRGADLSRADLSRAVLSGAVLSGADLRGAGLSRAVLRGADLRDADLRGAVLRGADLRDADLRDANLSGADLRDADLRGAVLRDADLSRAVLSGADLSGAVLRGALLSGVRNDLWDVLLRGRDEVPALLAALRAGRIDGSAYERDGCGCLVGTIEIARRARGTATRMPPIPHAPTRPAEAWFTAIELGDTPATSQVAAITEGWIVEFCALAGIEVPATDGETA